MNLDLSDSPALIETLERLAEIAGKPAEELAVEYLALGVDMMIAQYEWLRAGPDFACAFSG